MEFGVLSIQGDVSEHVEIMHQAIAAKKIDARVREVKKRRELLGLDGLLMPGGESTTMGKLAVAYGIDEAIRKGVANGMGILGTCAGVILLAKQGGTQVEKTEQPLLGLLDISVDRNFYGSQKDSFQVEVGIKALGKKPFSCVFIRAPIIKSVGENAQILAEHEGDIIMVRQNKMLGLTFHPELSGDSRIHEYFIDITSDSKT